MEAKRFVLNIVTGTCRPCRTAALLPSEEKGIVNQELNVYRTESLRVNDFSIIPLNPRGNIQSTVSAVAKWAAEIIKGHQCG